MKTKGVHKDQLRKKSPERTCDKTAMNLVEDYERRLKAGDKVDPGEYLARYKGLCRMNSQLS